MDSFDVSTGAAYAVLYSVLLFFTLLAIGAAGWLSFLPKAMTAICTLKAAKEGEVMLTTDYFLAARNSAGPVAIGLSFFASGMGAWVRGFALIVKAVMVPAIEALISRPFFLCALLY